jgi:ATP-dependent exoDNAse (exonuclease V) beta subunit
MEGTIRDPRTREVRPVRQGDIALLLRTREAVSTYANGLQAVLAPDVRVRAEEVGGFYQRPEIISTYHMLRLVLHRFDDTVLTLALRTPYLREADLSDFEHNLLQYRLGEGSALTDEFEDRHPEYHRHLEALRAAVRTETVPQLLGRVYRDFGIQEYFQEHGQQQAAANLEKLRDIARSMFSNEQALTLRQFTAGLRRAILTGAEEPEAEVPHGEERLHDYVRVMTIHKSKGLEFPIVVIPEVQRPVARGAEERPFLLDPDHGLDLSWPAQGGLSTTSGSFNASRAADLGLRRQEEMRILYVGVTRAQHTVVLLGGEGRAKPPTNDYYSWQDEIVRAGPALRAAGGISRRSA